MANVSLKDLTIAATYDLLLVRNNSWSATGNEISLMNDSGVIQPSGFYIDPTNDRIGIGTASPDYKLEIEGSTKDAARTLSVKCTSSDGGSDGGGILKLSHDEGSASEDGEQMGRIDFAAAEDGSGTLDLGASIWARAYGQWDHNSHGSKLTFATTPSTVDGDENPTARMTINDVGYVGIGTTEPGNELEVAAETPQIEISCWSTDPGYEGSLLFHKNKQDSIGGALVATEDGEDLGKIRWTGVNSGPSVDTAALIICEQDAVSGAHISGRISFHTSKSDGSTAPRLTIKSEGNVGIGTDSPDATLHVDGSVILGSDGTATELTIASGAVTVTKAYHTLDTEGDLGTDDLVTINGGQVGMIVFMQTVSNARDVVIKNSGNIVTSGASDVTLSTSSDLVMMVYGSGSKWRCSQIVI